MLLEHKNKDTWMLLGFKFVPYVLLVNTGYVESFVYICKNHEY